MTVRIGTIEPLTLLVGVTPVQRLYVGAVQVWSRPVAPAQPVTLVPVNTAPPVISGTGAVGATLTTKRVHQ